MSAGTITLPRVASWVASREHGSYHDYATADEAIRALIGDPR